MPEISPFVSSNMAILAGLLGGRLKRIKNDNIKANGTEQTILEYPEVGRVLGYIDLGEMQAGDTVIIRQYMVVKEGNNYKKYHSETYSGVQNPAILYIQPRESDVGIKITLQQTSGSYRTFPHDFMREL